MLSNGTGMAPDQDEYPGMTNWHARTGALFRGQISRHECDVAILSTKLRGGAGKAAPSTAIGLCVGYRLQTGAKWSGEHIVLDLDIVVIKNLRIDGQENVGAYQPLRD